MISLRFFGVVTVITASAALAQVPATCDAQQPADKYQVLRRLSLDLRGHVPSYEEYLQLDAVSEVPASTIAAYVASPDFKQVMRKYHEDLFWPNVSNVQLNNTNAQLTQKRINGVLEPGLSLSSANRRARFRGISDASSTQYGLQCGDYEQVNFETAHPDRKTPIVDTAHTYTSNGITVKQEGWRLVHPYWEKDPTVTVKVCASDAQETEMSPMFAAQGYTCGDYRANADPACGCGKNLKFCFGPGTKVGDLIRSDMREQLNRVVDQVSSGAQPYDYLVTTRTIEQSGTLDFYKKNLASNLSLANVFDVPDQNEPLAANPDFTDGTWHSFDRGSALHAGVLTAPAYLLRFQTNRSRANRYRIDFECEAFIPPSNIETAADGCAVTGTDLTGRCTCRYCHRTLEPLAAAWGQFSEAGTYLMDSSRFPRVNSNCVGNASQFCGRYYVTSATDTNPGMLLAWQYADAGAPVGDPHQAIAANLAAGPNGLIAHAKGAPGNAFAKCTVKRAFEYLMKREMRVAPPLTDEVTLQQSLAQQFATDNYNLPRLFQSIASRPEYRSLR